MYVRVYMYPEYVGGGILSIYIYIGVRVGAANFTLMVTRGEELRYIY